MSHATTPRLLLLAMLGLGSSLGTASELLFAPVPLDAAVAQPARSDAASTIPTAPSATTLALDAQALRQLELDRGAYAAELAGHYLSSARAQQAAGRHTLALDTLDKALHSERLQQGLFTPTQFEVMALQVESHLAQRDFLGAFARQQQLLLLQRRHYGADSTGTVDAQARLATLYFEAFRQVLSDAGAAATLRPGHGALSLFLPPESFTRHQLAYLWLGHARAGFLDAINLLLQAEAYTDPRLPVLEQHLIQTYLLQAYERRIAANPDNFLYARDSQLRDTLRMDELDYQQPFYRAGIAAHERLIAYQQARGAPEAPALAEAMLALGDWHLLFGRTRAARQQYQRTHALLAAGTETAALAPGLLQPALPRQLPAFAGLAREPAGAEFSGYVDIAFSIGKNGRVRDIEVLDATANADAQVQRQLRRQLQRAPFRPALDANGRLLGERRVSLRYHFAHI